MAESLGLVAVALCVLIAAAISRRIQGTIITLPMVYTALGLLIGPQVLGLLNLVVIPLLFVVTRRFASMWARSETDLIVAYGNNVHQGVIYSDADRGAITQMHVGNRDRTGIPPGETNLRRRRIHRRSP